MEIISSIEGGLLADYSTVTNINIELISERQLTAEARKITVGTTVGDFFIDGVFTKKGEIQLDQQKKKTLTLRHPLSVSEGIVTISTADGKTEAKPVSFSAAYPEDVFIDSPVSVLSNTSSLDVASIFIRANGKVSAGIFITYDLIDEQSNAAANVLFYPVSKIDSSARSKTKMKLQKADPGKYKIGLGYK